MHSTTDDKKIQEDVLLELEWDPEVNSSEIGVAVIDGIVTLSGQVDSYWTKKAAEDAAFRVKGVRGVAEDIVVTFIGMERTDTDIVDAVTRSIKWNTSIPDESLDVKVENGRVTLEGEVAWEYQRKAAEDQAARITGVTGVNNYIKIKPRVQASIVKNSIQRALERSAEIEADRIDVSTEGTTVVLRGKVRTWSERNEVQRAAWSTPGVDRVENHLVIG